MTASQGPSDHARNIGRRLREIRHQQGLSLREVAERSGGEFKISALGGYERGDRNIPLPRLVRLAAVYGVPIEVLLPAGATGATGGLPTAGPEHDQNYRGAVVIGLVELDELDAPERSVLLRYVDAIQRQRNDFNGRMITIRAEDVGALGRVFGCDPATMARRLIELGVRLP